MMDGVIRRLENMIKKIPGWRMQWNVHGIGGCYMYGCKRQGRAGDGTNPE